MKKSLTIIVLLVVVGLGFWFFGNKKSANAPEGGINSQPTVSAPVSDTTKVSDKLSEYKNEELGFTVKYPAVWQVETAPTGVNFITPIDNTTKNTVNKLESKITVSPGKCAFPPVTTVKERKTVKTDTLTFNMISMSNVVQGRNYFDRMYSLQNGSVCYLFAFSSITLSPASKGYKGSEATQMTNNNKALVDGADQAFTAMVKSFTYYTGPAGQDETTVVPTKK